MNIYFSTSSTYSISPFFVVVLVFTRLRVCVRACVRKVPANEADYPLAASVPRAGLQLGLHAWVLCGARQLQLGCGGAAVLRWLVR